MSMSFNTPCAIPALLAVLLWSLASARGDVTSAAVPELVFADAKQGKAILMSRDDFVANLSPFDRAARMKTDRDVTEKEFLEFVGKQAMDWDPAETQRLSRAFDSIRPRLSELLPDMPSTVVLVKTTGKEEGCTAYTRTNAIVIPGPVMDDVDSQFPKLLAHETFHIATRADRPLRERCYAAIGFLPCSEPTFPDPLKPRKITNPDAPRNDHCIRVGVGSNRVWTVPILFSQTEKYDPARGGEFFSYLTFGLLAVEGPANAPPRADAKPRMFAINSVSGFYEQVGENTQYVIHPEEILADNFSLLVLGTRPVPSPEVLEKIRAALHVPSVSAGKQRP